MQLELVTHETELSSAGLEGAPTSALVMTVTSDPLIAIAKELDGVFPNEPTQPTARQVVAEVHEMPLSPPPSETSSSDPSPPIEL
jgi:hypothetical protein